MTRARRSPLVLALILAVQLMVVLDMTVVNVALTDIARDLDFTTAALSWVPNAYTLAFGGLLLLGARAGDLLGQRRVLVAGIAVFTLASLAGGLAATPAVLLAARAAQGLGAAIAAPQALSLLTALYPEGRERTRALGLFSAVSIGGSAVGLILGGVLTEWASWRWVFFINVPVGAAIVAVTRRVIPGGGSARGHFDLAGAITSTIGMTSLVYGIVHIAEAGWTAPLTVASFAVGVVLLAGFVAVERRAERPIVPLSLVAHRTRATATVARLLLMAGTFGMFFFLTQFMQRVLGMTPLQTGLGFVPLTAGLLLGSQLSARTLIARFGARPVMLAGLSGSVVAMGWLTTITPRTGYLDLLAALILFGVGNGLAFVPLTALGLAGVTPGQAGAASGLLNAVQQVGGSLGLAVLVTVYDHVAVPGAAGRALDATAAARSFTQGSAAAFVASTAFLVAAVVAVGLLPRAPRRGSEPVALPAEPVAAGA